MRWRLLLEELRPHIQHDTGIINIVVDTLIRLKCTNTKEYESDVPTKNKLQKLFANTKKKVFKLFSLEKKLICVKEQREINKRSSYIKSLIKNKHLERYFKNIGNVNLILKYDNIYIPESIRETNID